MKWPKFKKIFLKKYKPTEKKRRSNLRKIGLACVYLTLTSLFFAAAAFAWFAKDLPTPNKIANRRPTESTKIYDRSGQILLYETGEQKRTIVEGDKISKYLKDATVATEDANFYSHHGFDGRAIAAAVAEKLLGKTRKTRGGSTITQQYVKNALLTSNRSLVRKIKELILAIELETMFSKEQILTMYLNEVPYGNNTAGTEAAARIFYGKEAKDLSLAEAATLAAIPKSPTFFSLYGSHIDRLIIRKNYVLDRMAETGKITKEEAEKAKEVDTTTVGKSVRPRRDSILAPHFAMFVLEKAADEYGEDNIQKKGLKIISSLDFEKQKIAEEAIKTGAEKFSRYNANNAAFTAVDPKTGQILAMVGSKDYFDISIDGNFNAADSLRQPGSSFKPFAYATAFKKSEFSPSKILFDLETDFGGGYVPQNYNGRFNGPITMRQALANSLNIPAVKVLALAGIDNVIRTAEDMGITSLTQRDRYGLSLVLGAGEVRPVEMAGAFGVFATGGTKHQLTPFIKITDSNNKTLYEYKTEEDIGRKVMDTQIAYEISSILSDNDSRSLIFGPRSALYFPDRPVAIKTGTTSSFKDAWTVGFTPSISAAVWVGNSNATPMKQGTDGSVVAAPIFRNFIEKALKDTAVEQFNRPEGIVELEVEKFSNKLPTEQSLEKTKDIFASWQAPTEQDNTNVLLTLCRGSFKLAPKDLPSGLTEERTIRVIHSEKPDNPSWEAPVRAWAEANGFSTGSLPTETCESADFSPEISITEPVDGASVAGDINIAASVTSFANPTSVEFFIDGVSIGEVASSPYNIIYDASNLSASANHKISAVAVDANKASAKSEINIKIAKDSVPPDISDINATYTKSSATISWETSEDATGQIFYGLKSSENIEGYANSTDQIAILIKNHSLPLTALLPTTKYYYRVVSRDANGNTAISTEREFTTLAQ